MADDNYNRLIDEYDTLQRRYGKLAQDLAAREAECELLRSAVTRALLKDKED